MSISLTKGTSISLEKKTGGGLTKVKMGLGWDPAKSGGLLGGLFGGGGGSIDLDASVIMMDAAKNAVDTVWFRQLKSKDGSIKHSGDNLTGDGDGDDESIFVDLSAVPANVDHLVFTVNSFRGQKFDEVDNAFARLVDEATGEEVCRFELREKGKHTGVIMASISRKGGIWEMTAHGVPCSGRDVTAMLSGAQRIL